MKKRLLNILITVITILMVPFIAMQLMDEVHWSAMDFLIMGSLLFLTGLALDWSFRIAGKKKIIISLSIALLFLLIWAELAVGLFGTPFAGS